VAGPLLVTPETAFGFAEVRQTPATDAREDAGTGARVFIWLQTAQENAPRCDRRHMDVRMRPAGVPGKGPSMNLLVRISLAGP